MECPSELWASRAEAWLSSSAAATRPGPETQQTPSPKRRPLLPLWLACLPRHLPSPTFYKQGSETAQIWKDFCFIRQSNLSGTSQSSSEHQNTARPLGGAQPPEIHTCAGTSEDRLSRLGLGYEWKLLILGCRLPSGREARFSTAGLLRALNMPMLFSGNFHEEIKQPAFPKPIWPRIPGGTGVS